MSIVSEERRSDSPYVEAVTHGWTESDGSTVRPAECRWHLVVVRQAGDAQAIDRGRRPQQELSPRTLRHHFLRATGLAHGAVRQVERANHAAARLRRGVSIPDVVHEEGYFDQSHMTRSLKR